MSSLKFTQPYLIETKSSPNSSISDDLNYKSFLLSFLNDDVCNLNKLNEVIDTKNSLELAIYYKKKYKTFYKKYQITLDTIKKFFSLCISIKNWQKKNSKIFKNLTSIDFVNNDRKSKKISLDYFYQATFII